jgi:homoserine O-succinyltransferase
VAAQRIPRIGVVNLMPQMEQYEPMLRAFLDRPARPWAFVGLRLRMHDYRSSDPNHLATYLFADEALPTLDAILLTGAPVETLPLAEVRYWPELEGLLEAAALRGLPVTGICWGAMALAERLGVPRVLFSIKRFGLLTHLGPDGNRSTIPHSRFAGFLPEAVSAEVAAGRIVVRERCAATGEPVLLATPDGRITMHIGHPEYLPGRLEAEWARDTVAGRKDVAPPEGLDADGRFVWEEAATAAAATLLDRAARGGPAAV